MKNVNLTKAFAALMMLVCLTCQLSAQPRASTAETSPSAPATLDACGFMACENCACQLDFCPCAVNLQTTEKQRKNILRYESLLRSYDSDATTKSANDIALIRIALQNNDVVLFKKAFEGYQQNVATLSEAEKTSIRTWGTATQVAVMVAAKE